jgi:hypothetical protein
MTRELTIEEKAMLWALKGNHLRVYPVPVAENYKTKNKLNKSITVSKVKLVIEHGNSTIEGKLLYRQDREMTEAINKIYVHYYQKRAN